MSKINSVQINLAESEDEVGYICGSVVSLDSTGGEVKQHKDLIDNRQYRSKHELILSIAYKIGVGTQAVSIVDV